MNECLTIQADVWVTVHENYASLQGKNLRIPEKFEGARLASHMFVHTSHTGWLLLLPLRKASTRLFMTSTKFVESQISVNKSFEMKTQVLLIPPLRAHNNIFNNGTNTTLANFPFLTKSFLIPSILSYCVEGLNLTRKQTVGPVHCYSALLLHLCHQL